ncbi:uncharacterized protein LOC135373407 [Ornithodoros turicata]|uniref:uncharacterized protein LOC135373407 n=1 Tax=Ornithodoros turicata TaxID=34597 RepID=UPI0031394CE5
MNDFKIEPGTSKDSKEARRARRAEQQRLRRQRQRQSNDPTVQQKRQAELESRRMKRKAETPEERARRLAAAAEFRAKKWKNDTPMERAQRKAAHAAAARAKRAHETEEERARRTSANAEAMRARRARGAEQGRAPAKAEVARTKRSTETEQERTRRLNALADTADERHEAESPGEEERHLAAMGAALEAIHQRKAQECRKQHVGVTDHIKRDFLDNPFEYACSVCDRPWQNKDLSAITEAMCGVLETDFPEAELRSLQVCATCQLSLNQHKVPLYSATNGRKKVYAGFCQEPLTGTSSVLNENPCGPSWPSDEQTANSLLCIKEEARDTCVFGSSHSSPSDSQFQEMQLSPEFSGQLVRVKLEPPDVPCLPEEGQTQQQHCKESSSGGDADGTIGGMCNIKEEPREVSSNEDPIIEVKTEPYNIAVLTEQEQMGHSCDSTLEGATLGMCHIKEEPQEDSSNEHPTTVVKTEAYNIPIFIEQDQTEHTSDSASEGDTRWSKGFIYPGCHTDSLQ